MPGGSPARVPRAPPGRRARGRLAARHVKLPARKMRGVPSPAHAPPPWAQRRARRTAKTCGPPFSPRLSSKRKRARRGQQQRPRV